MPQIGTLSLPFYRYVALYPGHVLPSMRDLGTRLGSVLTMLLYCMVCISWVCCYVCVNINNVLDLLQIFFTHLYKGGANNDKGTLVQLRNLINRRNVANDVSGRFNTSIDFFELVTKCHIVAAAMDFFLV